MINVKKIWFEKYRNEDSGIWLQFEEPKEKASNNTEKNQANLEIRKTV